MNKKEFTLMAVFFLVLSSAVALPVPGIETYGKTSSRTYALGRMNQTIHNLEDQ
ncbi:MAG: hypothetical protein HGA85_05655, partial [Nanoarchaeota archaeon]|nr:hypothetical protein [Nanoarchaeota archaeon]